MKRLFVWMIMALPLTAAAEPAGEFDYFVLALSWSPNWCETEGDARNSDQCRPHHDHGWIMHGLWPQFERGYPSNCQTSKKTPSRQLTQDMADIMGTSGLAWYQWKKHGSCSGFTAPDYFSLSRTAFEQINRPTILRRLQEPVNIAPKVIEEAFLQANPDLKADQITITCKQGYIQEARICLSKDMEPRRCGPDVIKDCAARTARFTPIR